LCTTVVHDTAQSSSDYLPSYTPDKQQSSSSDAAIKGEGETFRVIKSANVIVKTV